MRCISIVPFLVTLVGLTTGCSDATPDTASDGGARDHALPFVEPDLAEPPGPGDCMDRKQNGDETDIDCGGSCPRCSDGDKCAVDGDCANGVCVMGTCHVPDCHDGHKNGNETGVDCGGPGCLDRCPIGEGCKVNADCITRLCRNGACVAPPGTVLAFAAPVEYLLAVKTFNVPTPAIGDFNGDGKLDVAIADNVNPGMLVFNGRGDGTLGVPAMIPEIAARTIAGDFNGDGLADIVLGVGGAIKVMIATQNGFNGSVSTAVQGLLPASLISGDFDGDGNIDLAAITVDGRTVSILPGNGKGQFQPAGKDTAVPLPVQKLAAGDFNGDGKLDLATLGMGSRVLLQSGNLTFAESWKGMEGMTPLGARNASGDFNGDGIADLVENLDLGLKVYVADGKGGFQMPLNLGKNYWPGSIITGDFNVDGWTDLVARSGDTVAVHPGNGQGVFNAPVTIASYNVRDDCLGAGDFNRDGKPDIVYMSVKMNQDRFLGIALNTSR